MWSKNGDIFGVFVHLCCHLLFYFVDYILRCSLCVTFPLPVFFLTYLHSFVHVSCFFLVFYVFASSVLLFVLINFFLFLDYSCFVTSLLISASKRYFTKLSFCFSTCRPRVLSLDPVTPSVLQEYKAGPAFKNLKPLDESK